MTSTGQEFRDGTGFNRLNITNSDGVTINSAFSLPTTAGSVGDVMTRTGVLATTWAPPATPSYINNLTVTNLSQGPSDLVQNYTLPNYAPSPNSVLASATTYIMTFTVNASISFRVDNAVGGTIPFREEIPIGIYLVNDILTRLESTTRSVLSANNIIADIIFGYNSITDRFEIVLTNQSTPSNFLNFWWEAYDPLSPIPNNNNLFGIGVIIEPRLILPPIQTVVCQNAPIGVSLGTDCVWRSLASVQIPGIQSDSGASSIQCEDVGVGQNGIVSYGNYNLNNGSLNNCGNINALDNCNITTGTTQIINGLGEIKLNADSVDRLIVDDTKSALYSKNALSGPAGSLLELNNDNTFTLGGYFANNGIIECRPNSLAMYGNTASTAITMTDLDIITSLGVSGRIDREILDTTSQTFKDPTGIERLKIDSDVTVNGAYTLPTTAGVAGEVLTRATGTSTVWNIPQIYSIFSQIVNQTVANTTVETTIIGGGTPTSTLTVAPNFFTPGMTFRYTTGGLFQTSANNISARFRLRNSGVLFDSGLLVFSNRVIPPTPWNVDATFAYMGGTVMVTNFNFQYNAGNDARGFTSQQSNNTFDATISNTLNFTIQWSAASANNSITTNFGVVQKIY
jgi:hypothetical protein